MEVRAGRGDQFAVTQGREVTESNDYITPGA